MIYINNEKFISVSDFLDYLGTLPKDVRCMIFQHIANKEKIDNLCRIIEVHTKMLAKENEELVEKNKNLDSHKRNGGKNTLKSSMEDLD